MDKKLSQRIAFIIFRILGIAVVGILFWILGFIIYNGIGVINWEFLTSAPTEGMTSGGIFPAIVGTMYLIIGSMIFAFPLGVMSAIYTNEYAGNSWIVKFIRVMTNNLGSIPSIVFGLFGMALFVNTLGFGDSIIAGSLTLGLLVLPLIIRTTEEALKAVPDSYRTGSLALGATKLQTIRRVVLPKLPESMYDQVMALPYHLYVIATSGTDIEASRPIAYGTALVLIVIVLFMNILATVLRRYFGKKVKTN